MAIDRKINQGISKLRDAVATSISGSTITRTITETWVGPYVLLQRKQESVWRTALNTSLTPTAADSGQLTYTYEQKIDLGTEGTQLPEPTIEVIWQELRKPVTEHPAFASLSAETIKAIRDAAEEPLEDATLPPEAGEAGGQLYDLLIKGVTEYATGVPVVRRNSTKRAGDAGGGNAWTRESPPVSVPGSWEWMKTADERREDGDTFTLVEEWTGANSWDSTLYPS